MGKFFLLSTLLLGSVSSATEATLNTADQTASTIAQASVDRQQSVPSTRIPVNTDVAPNRVCLNIHAFIFETNDDRVPKLVGETTCMSVRTDVKRVDGPTAPRLIPAAGGNKF